MQIVTVDEAELARLLPLLRGYCDFYEVDPSDDELLALSRTLLRNPTGEGVQLLAEDEDGHAIGFATVYWTWSTLSASRHAVMNDLFVHPDARGRGVARALIEECAVRARRRGAATLGWQTAKDNVRAQRLYDRVGARREEWLDYSLDVSGRATKQ
jgi:ribosomal protein S18 acetylase RimI-like enzyme